MHAYERALQANPNSTAAMNAIGMLLKGREAFDKALEFFRAIVQLDQNNGEAWGNLGMPRPLFAIHTYSYSCYIGHCFLMTENLQKAYDAYQQALVNLRDPKASPSSRHAQRPCIHPLQHLANPFPSLGPHALVWHWHPVRSLWQLRLC